MATTIKSSDLDFDNIKASLRSYLGNQTEFADYDFEGSALSSIIDVLAYNTHLNALIANFALNETFLPTAQLRTSLVNHSLAFGYIPRSKTASNARLTVQVAVTGTQPDTITLPAGTAFTTEVEGVTYTFRTLIDYTGVNNGQGLYTFVDAVGSPYITVFEGDLTVKTFLAEPQADRQVYVVPDENLDLSTVAVQVYDNINSDNFTSYFSANATSGGNVISSVDANTALYLPLETYNGYWEFNFGVGGIAGKNPQRGEVIRITYLSTNGLAANGASVFTPVTPTISVAGTSYNLITSLNAKSSFGANKESIESIRVNAPLSYLAQNRLVAANDYIGVIANAVPGIKSINAWGGEDNIPRKFGKVMISLIYEDTIATDAQKVALQQLIRTNLTDPLSIISVDAEFVEPAYNYLNVNTNIKYDTSATNLTKLGIENKIRSTIGQYFSDNLGLFNSTFRRSALTTTIDGADPSILSSDISVTMQSRVTPIKNSNTNEFVSTDYTISFLNTIEEPMMVAPSITSEKFVVNNRICTIRNKVGHSTVLQIVDIDGNIVNDNIGSYVPSTGIVTLSAFKPDSISSGQSYIGLNAVPADGSDVKPLRNTVIVLGTNIVTASADTNSANAVSGVTN